MLAAGRHQLAKHLLASPALLPVRLTVTAVTSSAVSVRKELVWKLFDFLSLYLATISLRVYPDRICKLQKKANV